ncbi:MAG TPA: magnesium transporter [Polyangiaceae bacterium]|nr:magnesium transporter [Polyangiaceae bacterium]
MSHSVSEYPGPALPLSDLRDAWPVLSKADRADGFRILKRSDAEEFFLGLTAGDMAELLHALPEKERRVWVRLLAPDDAADLLQSADPEDRDKLISCLDDPTRKEVTALMAYAEDEAGGLMNPRFARVRPDMRIDEAVSYLRRQARENIETIYYVYVADDQQHLLGVVSFRDLFIASSEKRVRDVMATDLITVGEEVHQEDVSRLFADEALMAIPVVDPEGRIKGIVTVDDIVDVVQEEATEDAQKFGGMEALEEPYLQIALSRMIKKRGGWLAALFLGEMLTASAMAFFQDEIARAVVLALFVPLIISSGGNSGSQASTLVIRAMALGEVRLRDWWRVVRRELAVGFALGTMLGIIGFVRIVAWQAVSPIYGEHYLRVAQVVLFSLIGVVMFGTIAGSVLPFVLRRVGFDPASASAPFVATLVDVTGLVIYFSVGSLMLRGSLL